MPDVQDTPKRHDSWFRYSLRSLLLAALLVSVYLAGRYGTRPPSPETLVGR